MMHFCQYEDGRVVIATMYPEDVVGIEVEIPTVTVDQDWTDGSQLKIQEILSENLALEWMIKGNY